jgi:DNA-binding cell septation regulator SpoVG
MNINIQWHGDNFNVNLASAEGKQPFLEIKGCRIVNGTKGEFVSWPATKNQTTGKYWNHVYASEAFGQAVIEKAKAAIQQKQAPKPRDDDSDVPF